MWKVLDWVLEPRHFWVTFVILAIISIVGTLWAYDWDAHCLIAECRVVKR